MFQCAELDVGQPKVVMELRKVVILRKGQVEESLAVDPRASTLRTSC